MIFTLIPISSTFASVDENNSDIINSDKIINLSDEEYQDLLESLDDINILSGPSKPSKERTDWGNLVARPTYTHTSSGGIKQYNNSGNGAAAKAEFSRIGSGEVTQYVNRDKVTFVKSTPSGAVTLYTSTSLTAGAPRPSLSFLKDKIRFLGN